MKWKQMRLSSHVAYQTEVHKVRPKQTLSRARESQIKDAMLVVAIGSGDTGADATYQKRKRIRIGDK